MPKGRGDVSTPMLRQYLDLKSRHPEALLLYQLGDFYELFREDALVASGLLDLVLTKRGTGKSESMPMCGIPVRSASGYVRRLVEAGHTVAVADQVEKAEPGKLVAREVTEVVTPGTLTEEVHLDTAANWLAAVHGGKGGWGVAYLEISLGAARLLQVPEREGFQAVQADLRRVSPAEVLVSGKLAEGDLAGLGGTWRLAQARPVPDREIRALDRFLGEEEVRAMGLRGAALAKRALAHSLEYASAVGKWRAGLTLTASLDRPGDRMLLDPETLENLDVLGPAPSLLACLDHTATPMGRRELAERLAAPLTDPAAIGARLDRVEWWAARPLLLEETRRDLSGLPDLARAARRVEAGRAGPRDLFAIRDGLAGAAGAAHRLSSEAPPGSAGLAPDADLLGTLQEALPETWDDERWLRPEWDEELARWSAVRDEGEDAFARYLEQERRRTGIDTLRVGQNKVFGRYLQVSRGKAHLAPADYERRQSLANAERFTTEALRGLEKDLLLADDRWRAARAAALDRLLAAVARKALGILAVAAALADLDVAMSLALAAEEGGWSRPEVGEGKDTIAEGLRHPVVEAALPPGGFVPNEARLEEGRRCGVVTGPNMAGKSTYIRSVALLSIMAQAGSFVAARRARVGVADAVFARIGSSDAIAEGRSTFLVEMAETAAILHQATRHSVVVLDEIGRGTATFDGMAIAWAVAEHLAGLGARTLFATHYHELCDLEELEGVFNLRVEVARSGKDLVFLHAVSDGRADRAYGVEVAGMAGFPPLVLRRAREILTGLEARDAPASEEAEERGQQGLF